MAVVIQPGMIFERKSDEWGSPKRFVKISHVGWTSRRRNGNVTRTKLVHGIRSETMVFRKKTWHIDVEHDFIDESFDQRRYKFVKYCPAYKIEETLERLGLA